MKNRTSQFQYQTDPYSKTISTLAPVSRVWEALTRPEIMKQWMSEEEIHICTNWKVGEPIKISGKLHQMEFENKGVVLQFEPKRVLQYNHLSTFSKLPDEPESYSVFTFRLTSINNHTNLLFILHNFPTEIIYKHLVFYWNSALEILKKHVEA